MRIQPKHRRILMELLSLPTAPFCEEHVESYVRRFCRARRALSLRADRWGNLLVQYQSRRKRPTGRPVAFVAHMDHPGFQAVKILDGKHVLAEWRGGVEQEYFPNAAVRFHVNDQWVRGRIERIESTERPSPEAALRVDRVRVKVSRPVPAGAIGMWDLPEPAIRGKRIIARDCDDMAGLAAILCALETLCRTRAAGRCYALLTRAEEVGFAGAIAAAKDGTLPKRVPVLSIETSKALPNAPIGAGPVLRIGDKASVFSAPLSAHCRAVADELRKKHRDFQYQRKLMDGGTCEATAFYELGYEAAGICLQLGNYHNRDEARKRITSEYVGLEDWLNLVRWFVALATCPRGYRGRDPHLRRRLDHLLRRYRSRLSAARKSV
jgi:endoglucanase